MNQKQETHQRNIILFSKEAKNETTVKGEGLKKCSPQRCQSLAVGREASAGSVISLVFVRTSCTKSVYLNSIFKKLLSKNFKFKVIKKILYLNFFKSLLFQCKPLRILISKLLLFSDFKNTNRHLVIYLFIFQNFIMQCLLRVIHIESKWLKKTRIYLEL